jgi:ABC-type branched-subunit amino acid transport system substrate-binding protein/uncharacterized caspase-like protein
MSKNFAIVVGINQYDTTSFESLNHAKHDAEVIRDFFQEAQFDEIIFFSDNSPLQLSDENHFCTYPNHTSLRSYLHDRFEKPFLKRGDNCWFFFSGHGYLHNNREYLMPSDANVRQVEQTGIQVNYVRERLSRCGSDNIILILDACRSEGSSTVTGKSSNTTGIGGQAPHGVITFYSCSQTQRSWESDDLKHSLFTYALLEALKLNDKDNNCATVERLGEYLQKRVPELCKKNAKKSQNPSINIEPLEKRHFILIPKYIKNPSYIQSDIVLMERDAYRIEQENRLDEAENIWTRLLEISPSSCDDAIKSFQRIAITRKQLEDEVLRRKFAIKPDVLKLITTYLKKTKGLIKNLVNLISKCPRKTWFFLGIAILVIVTIVNLGKIQKIPSRLSWVISSTKNKTVEKPKINSQFISDGEKPLFEPQYFDLSSGDLDSKINGMKAFSNDHFPEAFGFLSGIRTRAEEYIRNHEKESSKDKTHYLAALKDPELLIFANNARLKTPDYSNLPFRKIAVVVPTNVKTSAANAVGKYFLWGVAQAQDEAINNGKLGLHIQIVNDGNNDVQSGKVAQEIVDDLSIVGVIGHYLSTTTCTALPIYNEKLAVVSPASRAFNLRQIKNCSKDGNKNANKNFFRTAASSQVEAISLVNHLLSKFEKNKFINVVAFNTSDMYSSSIMNEFTTHLNTSGRAKVTPFDMMNTSAYQYEEEIKKAEAIAVFPDGQNQKSLGFAIDMINKYENDKIILAGNTLYFQEQLSNMAKKNTPGNVVIAVDWHPRTPKAIKFAKEEHNYWHGDINFRTALAYEATQVFIKALTNISQSSTDRSTTNISQLEKDRLMVQQEISKLDLINDRPILEGRHIRFDTNGDRQEKQNVCVTPIRSGNVNPITNKSSRTYKEPRYNFLPNSPCDKQDVLH